jgi:hypothetical protein
MLAISGDIPFFVTKKETTPPGTGLPSAVTTWPLNVPILSFIKPATPAWQTKGLINKSKSKKGTHLFINAPQFLYLISYLSSQEVKKFLVTEPGGSFFAHLPTVMIPAIFININIL